MPGEIEQVLERAARDPAFLSLLLDDRESAVASLDVDDAVKQVLLSADASHLEKMVRDVRDAGPKKRPRVSWLGVGGVVAAAATIGYVAIPDLAGLPRETIQENEAERALRILAMEEVLHFHNHGRYAAMDELVADGAVPAYLLETAYDITLELSEKTFTLRAIHKTRPDTRKAFVVGPDCQVRELEDRE